jgi:hypothetical protein
MNIKLVFLAIEHLDSDMLKPFIKDLEGLYRNESLLNEMNTAFKEMRKNNNTRANFDNRFLKTKQVEENTIYYRTKFCGNKTSHFISLFFEVRDLVLTNIYDVTDVTKKDGTILIGKNQILVFPLHETYNY